MDEEIRTSLRNLKLGFQAGQFTTKQLLDILGITKVYLASGTLQGVFFSPGEVVTAAKHYQEVGHLITEEHVTQLQSWAAEESPKDITLECREARHWFPPEERAKSEIDIIVMDLSQPPCLACHDGQSVTRLNSYFTPYDKCGNENCKSAPCFQHMMQCVYCDTNYCVGCMAGWVNDQNQIVDHDTDYSYLPVCLNCAEERSKLAGGK